MFNNKLGIKSAQETAKYVLKLNSEHGKAELPFLTLFSKGDLDVIYYPELYHEFRGIVNNGGNKDSVRIAYDDSNKFGRFIAQHFPTLEQANVFTATKYVATGAGGIELFSKV